MHMDRDIKTVCIQAKFEENKATVKTVSIE